MKITCVKDKLKNAIDVAERITGRDVSLPVLTCVLLKVNENTLSVRATNLEIGVEISVPVKVQEKGQVAVPADVFKRFLSGIGDEGSIILEAQGTVLHVNTDHFSTKIKTFEHEEFPSIPEPEENVTSLTLPAAAIKEGFQSVWYAASVSNMKPELSSVYVEADDEELVFVATDSFRLAEKRQGVKDSASIESLLIPHQNVGEIIRILSNSNDDIEVKIGENQVSFSLENTYVTSRIIDGVFPDYKQIIPSEHSTTVTVLKEELSEKMNVSSIFSDKFNKVTFSVTPDSEELSVVTQNQDVGENKASVPAKIEGGSVEMSFNHRYITDCFQSIPSDSLKLSLEEGKPMVVRGVNDNSFRYLVMPMNE